MKIDKEQILDKHLKQMLKRTKQSYFTIDEMKRTPEYKAVLNAMVELETTLVKNNAVSSIVLEVYCANCGHAGNKHNPCDECFMHSKWKPQ